jgi:hypothetical protein
MEYEAWQHKRANLLEKERAERSVNWQQARAPIQAAITEQAVRELYDRVAELTARLSPLEQIRGIVKETVESKSREK